MNGTSLQEIGAQILQEIGANWVYLLFAMIAGLLFGITVALLLKRHQSRAGRALAEELFRQSEAMRQANVEAVIGRVKESFGSLSLDALSRSTEEFLKLAKERLDSERKAGVQELDAKKGLIDLQLQRMTTELDNVSALMKSLEKDRSQKYGELASQMKAASEQTARLMHTTSLLQEALASTKARGQWGERMAEDVLRIAGFIENVNYTKQKVIEGPGTRPDFTFLLPRDLTLNMDVKFPLDNYLRYLEAPTDPEKDKLRADFLRDVKARIKEVATRAYINPEQNTVDYVLLFIPNEQIYAFIHEQDNNLLEDTIKNKVIFCSPITLFAVLAVIRQAVENFALEQTSNEMLTLFGTFRKQWGAFLKKFELLGKRIADAQKEYDALTTTRRRQLDRPLNRIEELRTQRNLPAAAMEEEEENDLIVQAESEADENAPEEESA